MAPKRRSGLVLSVGVLPLLACACQGDAAARPLGVQVQWLTGDLQDNLPEEVEQARIVMETRDEEGNFQVFDDVTVGFSMDMEGRFIQQGNFPAGEEFRVQVEGQDATGTLLFLGQVRPLVLNSGDRRIVEMIMYELGSPLRLPTERGKPPGRVLHTATRLADERVLIAGGFDVVSEQACPPGGPGGARCFEMTATREAFLFDVAEARFHPVRESLLEARGGHTATVLPDGRVLLAGGAARARLTLAPDGDEGAWLPTFEPLDGDPSTTFELFDPRLNAEMEDVARNGDPRRGGFTGPGEGASPGTLQQERFMHAAVAAPDGNGNVLLVGGSGTDGGDSTWEVYVAQDEEVLDNAGNDLGTARSLPSAVALPGVDPPAVWIVGGTLVPQSNGDLAAVWTSVAGDPNGIVQPATGATEGFPNGPGNEAARPELAHLRPELAPVDGGSRFVSVGWVGTRCVPDTPDPAYATAPDGNDTVSCPPPVDGSPARGITVTGMDGSTVPMSIPGPPPPSFGDTAVLDDGRIVIAGGVGAADWTVAQQAIELFAPQTEDGVAPHDGGRSLADPRILGRATALQSQGLLVTGGLTIDDSGISLPQMGEVLYLDRSPLPRPR